MVSGLAESTGNKISDQAISDGGRMPGTFELGSDLSLGPFTRDNGLIGYWTFDEGSGTTAYDYSGNGNTGTTGGTTIILGKVGNARSFNGVTDNVNAGTNTILNQTNNLTVAAWVYNQETRAYKIVLSRGKYQADGWYWWLDSSGWRITINNTGTSGGPQSGVIIQNNAWHHMVMVIDNVNLKTYFYYDGQLKTTGTNPFVFAGNASQKFIAGDYSDYLGTYTWMGSLDDIRVYNRALSAEEILAIYNTTK